MVLPVSPFLLSTFLGEAAALSNPRRSLLKERLWLSTLSKCVRFPASFLAFEDPLGESDCRWRDGVPNHILRSARALEEKKADGQLVEKFLIKDCLGFTFQSAYIGRNLQFCKDP